MDSSCYRCASHFGFFKKEVACSKCGYGFCKKCLPHQMQSPSGPVPVCSECFKSLDGNAGKMKPAPQETKYDEVPENFKKRVAILQEKKVTSGKKPQSKPSKGGHATTADQDIADRLQKLKNAKKQEIGPVASLEEMEERLRALKGLPDKTDNSQSNKFFQPPDTRTNQEKSQDLVTQMKDEARLDSQLAGPSSEAMNDEDVDVPSPLDGAARSLEDEIKGVMHEAKHELKTAEEGKERDAEMEERLAKLHGLDLQTYRDKGKKDLEEMSEQESTRRYIAQLLEESRLDEKLESDGYSQLMKDSRSKLTDKSKSIDPDELPWCCICNEDACVRCHDCDGDIYCKTCFRQGHDEFEMKYHKTSRYRPPQDADR